MEQLKAPVAYDTGYKMPSEEDLDKLLSSIMADKKYWTMLQAEDEDRSVLGIRKFPEDNVYDYRDYRDSTKWKELIKLARKCGVKVYVKELQPGLCDEVRGMYSVSNSVHSILVNKKVPNWYKPRVLSQELFTFLLYTFEDAGKFPYYKHMNYM